MKPIAVLISDIHYNIQTLPLADAAMRRAIDKANSINVPLIVAGDLHDTKANVRGECMIAMRKTFSQSKNIVTILRGNHDSLSERSIEHSLTFLPINCNVIATPSQFDRAWATVLYSGCFDGYLIPYHHDPDELRAYLKTLPPKSTLIMHQGITGSNSGDYIQDKSAITSADVAGFRVISGHYHTRQTIELPEGGRWDFIGNPYSLNFGEASDPPKGFQILMEDGSLEFVPTNLRKHVKIEARLTPDFTIWSASSQGAPGDLVWLKLVGPSDQLTLWPKERVASKLGITDNFRFETETTDAVADSTITQQLQPQNELFDSIIDSLTNTENDRKARLKALWKDLIEGK